MYKNCWELFRVLMTTSVHLDVLLHHKMHRSFVMAYLLTSALVVILGTQWEIFHTRLTLGYRSLRSSVRIQVFVAVVVRWCYMSLEAEVVGFHYQASSRKG